MSASNRLDDSLIILNNPNEFYENDFAVINLFEQTITWKAGRFNPKLRSNIYYWFNEVNKQNGINN